MKPFLLAACLTSSTLLAHPEITFPKRDDSSAQVMTAQINDPVLANYLQDHFDVWLYVPHTGKMDLLLDEVERAQLSRLGIKLKVDQKLNAGLTQSRKSAGLQVQGILNFPCYRTVEETYASMDQLAYRHPSLVRILDFGDSYLKSTNSGGYDLWAMVVENTATPGDKPPLLLIAAIHAREYTTAETAMRWTERLLANYATNPDVRWLLDHRRLIVVPIMNPDGRKRAEAGASWRRNLRPTCVANANNHGVDLNRNSSFLWGTNNGSSTNLCADTYRGTAAASEPEVQALQALMGQVFVDQRGPLISDPAPLSTEGVFISLHSYADLVLFPWGAQATDAPNFAGLRGLARKMGYYTGYRVCQPPSGSCLYAASGTSDDHSYGEFGVASMTFEIGNNGFFEQCSIYESQSLGKILPALDFALKAARRPYSETFGPEVLSAAAETVDGQITLRATADDTRSNSNGLGNEPASNISNVALFLSPPWLAGSQPQTMLSADDGSFNSSIENVTATVPSSLLNTNRQLAWLVSVDANKEVGVPTGIWLSRVESSILADGFE